MVGLIQKIHRIYNHNYYYRSLLIPAHRLCIAFLSCQSLPEKVHYYYCYYYRTRYVQLEYINTEQNENVM